VSTPAEINGRTEPWQRLLFYSLFALLLFAPLFRAGNRPIPLLIIELLALLLLLALLWQPARLRPIPGLLKGIAAGVLLLPLLYLIPWPEALWQLLPGRELYAEILQDAGGWRPLSLVPLESEGAFYAALPAVAVFIAAYLLPVGQVRRLVYLLLVVAAVQATLGLMQFGAGPGSWLYFGNPYASHFSAAGTYANRDHLAGLLEMVFPVALALMVATMGRGSRRGRGGGSWRRRVEFLSSIKGHQALIFGALTLLLLLGLVFTRSRAGVALAMVGLFLSLLLFARRLGGTNVYGTLGSVAAVAVILAAEIGLAPVLNRFASDPLQDARWTIFSGALEGIGRFFPLGSGAGTFDQVYPRFQATELGGYFVNNAHNDYLEALFEGGIFSLLLLLAGLWVLLRQWPRLMHQGRWGSFRFIQAGAGIGVLLMLMHSLVDFNLHIPANAVIFAFLTAVFLKECQEEHQGRRRRRRSVPREQRPETQQTKTPQDKDWEGEKNPFLD